MTKMSEVQLIKERLDVAMILIDRMIDAARVMASELEDTDEAKSAIFGVLEDMDDSIAVGTKVLKY